MQGLYSRREIIKSAWKQYNDERVVFAAQDYAQKQKKNVHCKIDQL